MIKGALWLAALLMLHGCATATGYGHLGLSGGYSQKKLDDSHYIVTFDGNGYTSSDRVWYFWIYRCAELTASHGFTYFTLDPHDPHLKKSSFRADDAGHLQAAVMTDRDPPARPVETGTIYIGPITTWHSAAVVSMYGNTPPTDRPFLQAAAVLRLLADYVHSDGKGVPPSRNTLLEEAGFVLGPNREPVNIHAYLLAHPPTRRHQLYDFPAPPMPAPPPPPAPPRPPLAAPLSGA